MNLLTQEKARAAVLSAIRGEARPTSINVAQYVELLRHVLGQAEAKRDKQAALITLEGSLPGRAAHLAILDAKVKQVALRLRAIERCGTD